MQVSQCVGCEDFPCADVRHECYIIPGIDVKPDSYTNLDASVFGILSF